MTRLLHTLAILLALACPAAAAPAPLPSATVGQGLTELLVQALSGSPAIGGAEATQTAANRASIDALLGFAPRASWVFDNSRERLNVKRSNSPVYHVGISNFGNYGNTLQILQPLFDPRLLAQLHGSSFGKDRARAELDGARQKVIFEVIQSYLITLGSADALAAARAEEASLNRQHEQTQLRAQRGLGSQVDLDEVTSRLMQSRSQLTTAEVTLSESFAGLEHRVAGRVTALLPLAGPIGMAPPSPADPQVWVDQAKAHNPDVLVLEGAAGEAFATFEQQGAALSPRVDLTYTQNRAETGGSVYGGGSLTTDRTVLFRLTVPLFNAEGTGYPVLAAHARYRAAKYRIEDQRLDVEERVRVAYEEIGANATRADQIARAAAAQERVVQAKREKFSAGLIRITEVLDAERDLFQVRRQLLAARYNYLLNLMQLKRLAGDISEADAAFIDADLERGGPVVVRVASGSAAGSGDRIP